MKKILYLLIFIIFSPSLFAEAGLYIRFKPYTKIANNDAILKKEFGINSYEALLKPEQTLYYNQQKRKVAKIQSNEKLMKILKTELNLSNTYFLELHSLISPEKYGTYIQNKYPEIDLVEVKYPDQVQEVFIPSDLRVSNQEHLINVKAYEAWFIEKGNPDLIIGIYDDGFDQTHEDLMPNIALNLADPLDGIDTDKNGYIDDYNGFDFDPDASSPNITRNTRTNHGTNVAGISSAMFDNNLGIAGTGGFCKFFPLKIAKGNEVNLSYGYKAIIYAAQRGFKVLNCSWGSRLRYSQIEQSIIDYAVAMDVAVVAASGNTPTSGFRPERFENYYPAAYDGVLGVGSVNLYDVIADDCALGKGAGILAPGIGNYSTHSNSNYTYLNIGGTSFASPAVAGALGLLRSRYPNLDAEQSIELLRQSVDNVDEINPLYTNMIPGRLNMLKAVSTDPFSIPGLIIDEIKYNDANGQELSTWTKGDVIYPQIHYRNVLGVGNNLNFTLSRAYDRNVIVEIIDDKIENKTVVANETGVLSGFSIRILEKSEENIFLRLEISGEKNYSTNLIIELNPDPEIVVFENELVKYGVGQLGTIGHDSRTMNKSGVGFELKNKAGQLFQGGIFVVSDTEELASATHPYNQISNDFFNTKRISTKDPTLVITPYEIETESGFPIELDINVETGKDDEPFARFIIKAKNFSDAFMPKVAIGYVLDWDVGEANNDFEQNITSMIDEAKPDGYAENSFAAQYAGHISKPFTFGSASYSTSADAIGFATGLVDRGISSETLFLAPVQGKSNQTPKIGDVANIVGTLFFDGLNVGEEKECVVCIAGGETKEQLADALKKCLAIYTNVENDANHRSVMSIYNSDGRLIISNPNLQNLKTLNIYNYSGAMIYETNFNSISNQHQVEHSLGNGIYFIEIESANELYREVIFIE